MDVSEAPVTQVGLFLERTQVSLSSFRTSDGAEALENGSTNQLVAPSSRHIPGLAIRHCLALQYFVRIRSSLF